MPATFYAFVILLLGLLPASVENRSYETGLIFYDLDTKHVILPPTVSVSRGRSLSNVQYSPKGSIWSTFGMPCSCEGPVCGCCVGIQVKQYMFDEKMCANFTFVPDREEARLDVFLNERNAAKYGIYALNPSPLCVPVMMPIPMAMCVQLSDISLKGNSLNMCMDFVMRLHSTDLFEMHFQCMQMGLDGFQYLDKNGQPVFPPEQGGTSRNEEYYNDDDDAVDDADWIEEEREVASAEAVTELSPDTDTSDEDLEDLQHQAIVDDVSAIDKNETEMEEDSTEYEEESITNNYIRVYS